MNVGSQEGMIGTSDWLLQKFTRGRADAAVVKALVAAGQGTEAREASHCLVGHIMANWMTTGYAFFLSEK